MYNPSIADREISSLTQDGEIEKKAYFKTIASHCDHYKESHLIHSLSQFSGTILLFLTSCTLMIASVLSHLWWGYALLLLPTSGLLVRLFIIQHDCGHGSFFKTSTANDRLGRFISLLTWTPYHYWKRVHNIHHAGSGNLERRGYGSIETLTVHEYKALSQSNKIKYRLYRNPFLLLLFAAPLFIIIAQRFSMFTQPFLHPEGSKKVNLSGKNIKKSILQTNLTLAIAYGLLGAWVGYTTLFIVYLPILVITACIGGWLFYVQHQFEDTHWEHQEQWSYNEAAIMGSSYYDLPKWLQWFTGSIGIHHIHHLNASIPNYRLQECLDDFPALKHINRMSFRESLKCLKWALWDESAQKMVSFATLKTQNL